MEDLKLVTYKGLTLAQLDEVIDYYKMHMGRLPNEELVVNAPTRHVRQVAISKWKPQNARPVRTLR